MNVTRIAVLVLVAVVGLVLVLTASLPAETVWEYLTAAAAGAGVNELTRARQP